MDFLRTRYRYKHLGLLLLRIGIGIMFFFHGLPKLQGGTERWEKLGTNMQLLGIDFAPAFWGFMAGFAEGVGGILLMLGLFFRPVTLLLLFTMLIATARHAAAGDGFGGYSHALESGILFLSLFFIGPGKYSLDQQLFPSQKTRNLFR